MESPVPKSALLGPRFWIAGFSLVAVLAVGVVDLDRTAPGPVSKVHAMALVADGASESDCSACHGGWFESMDSACFDCHDGIEADLDEGLGLHGLIEDGVVDAAACGTCHGEHNGAGFALAGPRSFDLAGTDRDEFDHGLLGYEMLGGHLDLACVECHEAADESLLPLGTERFRGLDSDCASCHSSEHAPVFSDDCTKCHNQEVWEEQSWAAHPAFFPREGAHAEAECRACHGEGTDASLEIKFGRAGSKALDLSEVRGCAECHMVPHTGGFLQVAGDCVDCHGPTLGAFETADVRLDLDVHALAGFALDAPHNQLECANCHGEKAFAESDDELLAQFEQRHPGRERGDCVACHSDPHGGQFAQADDCVSCHAQDAFAPHLFDEKRHGELDLALDGGHGSLECASCHGELEGVEDALAFRGTDAECAACHADAHAGFEFADVEQQSCSECHDDVAFDRAAEGFAHGAQTGFELAGAHGQEDCASCHAARDLPDEAGRSFGRIDDLINALNWAPSHGGEVDFAGTGECGLCHGEVHGDVFAAADSCATCHSANSFRTGLEDFEHGEWTGFALEDRHGKLDCTACHAPDASALRGMAPAAGNDCASCHTGSHAGQFDESPRGGDCARCHTTAATFAEPKFNHNFDSDFRLEGRHTEIGCADCHAMEDMEGQEVRRYWPVVSDCSTCHGVVKGSGLGRRSGGALGQGNGR